MGVKKDPDQALDGLNFKQERFCQLYVKYAQDAKRAFVEAKLDGDPEKGSLELLQDDQVQKRVEVLQETIALRNNLTPDKVIEMILNVYRSAIDSGRYDAANRSAEMLGKYLGMFVDKSETKQLVVSDPAKLDDDIKRFAKIAGLEVRVGNA